MKAMACAVAAISMLAGAAQAGQWRLVTANNETATFLDVESRRTLPSGKMIAWTALLYVEPYNGVDYMMVQSEFDCTAETESYLSLHAYGPTDRVIFSSNTRQNPLSMIPDSNGYAGLKAVCQDIYGEGVAPDLRGAIDVYRRTIREGQ